MKVYLLESGGCMDGDHEIIGIFSTRDKAEEWVRTKLSKVQRIDCTITEMELDNPDA